MYIRNIIGAIEELKDDEVLCVNYKSGKSNRIFKKDTVEKVNGELKITRELMDSRCIVYIDTAEVESVIIRENELKNMGGLK